MRRPAHPAASCRALALAALLLCAGASAADHFIRIDTRPGVRVGYWMMERPGASATLLLLPGGNGGMGVKDGVPASENFLVRSRERFAAHGFDVAIVGPPSDRPQVDLRFRTSNAHMADLRAVVERLRLDTGKPVWLVGTSNGTVSAAAGAIALGDRIAGVVLTSSRSERTRRASLLDMDLAKIAVPVLVLHHRRDACGATPPEGAARIAAALTHAPERKLVMLDGGGGASGDPCEALHWHGFIGAEGEAVDAIAAFIRNPSGDGAPRGPSPGS